MPVVGGFPPPVPAPFVTALAKLVVGLGNPGPEYASTRHNVGFCVADRLAAGAGAIFESAKALEGYRGPRAFTAARLPKSGALVVKPETWMNRSGRVVAPLASWAGAAPEDVLVIYDDLDLDLGRLRLRPHGGHGGHNGVRSVLAELGSDGFPRLRVGIGPARGDPADFVLQPFGESEREDALISVIEAAEAALHWTETGDIDATMTKFQTRWNQGP